MGLAETFASSFRGAPPALRTIGREAEHPVVTPDGQAADVRPVLERLAAAGDFAVKREGDMIVGLDGRLADGTRAEYALEVGWGTIEIITGPHPDLPALERAHESAVAAVVRETDALGCRLLGYGVQPLTPGDRALMSPKSRYGIMLESLGDLWLWFTLTASDQTHVDVARDELIRVYNVASLMTPAVVALCGNSPIFDGVHSGACSSREQQMGAICAEESRHGMPAGPAEGFDDYVAGLTRQRYLIGKRGGVYRAESGRFDASADADDFDAFLTHEHYIWNSARPRTAHSTIELRSACQQPWGEHMAASALSLGIVESAPALGAHLEARLGADVWPEMRAWHHAAVRDGLAAPEPTDGLLGELLEICEAGLRARGLGEARYLAPLWRRLALRRSPAQEALQIVAEGGIPALVEARSVRI